MIHGTALEVSAVRENLLGQLGGEDLEALRQPGIRLLACKEQAGENQRFRIGQQMVPQEMILASPGKIPRLQG